MKIPPDLDAIYKRYSGNTHQAALEAVFEAGVNMGLQSAPEIIDQLKTELATLREKYDALNQKFNINQPTIDEASLAEMNAKISAQMMDMGNAFKLY